MRFDDQLEYARFSDDVVTRSVSEGGPTRSLAYASGYDSPSMRLLFVKAQ